MKKSMSIQYQTNNDLHLNGKEKMMMKNRAPIEEDKLEDDEDEN